MKQSRQLEDDRELLEVSLIAILQSLKKTAALIDVDFDALVRKCLGERV